MESFKFIWKAIPTWFLLAGFIAPAAYAEWRFQEVTDPITDEDASFAGVMNGPDEVLVVRCLGEIAEIPVGVGGFFGFGAQIEVTYRVDRNDPVAAGTWNVSTNGNALFAPRSQINDLLNLFRSGQSIVIRATDERGSSNTATFSLAGANEALSKLSCVN